jgi:hypothetical protein
LDLLQPKLLLQMQMASREFRVYFVFLLASVYNHDNLLL